ncbi:MAG: hypothetical protein ACFFDI_29770 [Promethearchaeota archaeon]
MSKMQSSILTPKTKFPHKKTKSPDIRNLVESVFFQPIPTLNSSEELEPISLAVITFKDWGPDVNCFENLTWENQPAAFLAKLGVFYMTIIGQGSSYHHGLYGPVPVHSHSDREAYLFGFSVYDDSIKDKRANGTAYSILTVFFPKSLKNVLHSSRETINKLLSRVIGEIENIDQLTPKSLEEIKEILKEGVFYHNTLSTSFVS